MTRDKHTGRYRLGLNSLFVPDAQGEEIKKYHTLQYCHYVD